MIPDDVIVKAGINMLAHTDMVPLEYVRQVVSDVLQYVCTKEGAPNHSHSRPGIWDADNGRLLANQPCEECAAWNRLRDLATLEFLLPVHRENGQVSLPAEVRKRLLG